MSSRDERQMGGNLGRFPTTHWSALDVVRDSLSEDHLIVLNHLMARYWKPVYCYIRFRRYGIEEAKDLTQDFFASCLAKNLFGRADRTRGRFRTLLLSSLDNFLKNVHRARYAKRRCPPNKILSLDELMEGEHEFFIEPSETDTPQAVFERSWASNLLTQVLQTFEEECSRSKKDVHFVLFRRRILEPAIEGREPPPLRELAQYVGLSERQAANCLITARRAYQRLLRQEIKTFASSEDDVAAELLDLFRLLSR